MTRWRRQCTVVARATRALPCLVILPGAALLGAGGPARATIQGLNQIVTPDIQPPGLLSVTALAQPRALGNGLQLQLELGTSGDSAVALFQGFRPGEFLLGGVEYGLVQKPRALLSAGLLWPSDRVQPFLVGGHRRGADYLVAGSIRDGAANQLVLGWTHRVDSRLTLMADYQSGRDSYATAGVNYKLTPTLSLVPAVFISNASPHRAYVDGVLTWNVRVWE